jgi:hypothetical protein
MMRRSSLALRALAALLIAATAATTATAQTAYGVNAAGTLFSFDVTTPANVTVHGVVGAVGFVPEGIDFRPGSSTLYAIDIGPNTSQLYTIDIATGVPTTVGAGFNSSGVVNAVPYNLTGNQTFGFDFNPTTLQADNSMRIRLVATNNANLRLNSSTGAIAAVDADLNIPPGNSPFIDAAAYINNTPTMGGTTALYDMDSRNDALYLQNPPNNGTVTQVGSFGFMIDAQRNIGFDIYTTPGNVDPSLSGDFGFAVLKRPDAPLGGPLGSYLLYNVNLATGGISNGALVGPAATPYDFDGGFAVLPGVPEPSAGLLALVASTLAVRRRQRS